MKQYSSEELTSLDSSELLGKLDELRHAALNAGCEMAEREIAYKNVKDLLPSILAEIQIYYKNEENNMSEAKIYALHDPKYVEKIHEMNELGYTFRLKEIEYRSLIESIRALAAISFVRNQELKLARG